MTTRILFAGEVMGELRKEGGGFSVGFAGDTFNAAVYCRRGLEHAAPNAVQVAYLTRVGRDPMSQGVLDLARSEGVETNLISRDHTRNLGLYAVETNQQGERSFSYWRNQSAARQLFANPSELDALEQANILCLSGISLAILPPQNRASLLGRIAELRRSNGLKFAFDSNYRPALWEDQATACKVIEDAWALTDIALPSIDDEMDLFGDTDENAAMRRLRGYGLKYGALKRAEKGPVPIASDAMSDQEFSKAEKVVDTTAAGDSFNGGFLAAHIQGLPITDCLMAGHLTARGVVGQPGAIIPNNRNT